MTRPGFRVYIATSLDGFIATSDGGVEWLDPFQAEDFGYEMFVGGINTLVMGRKTYDQVRGFGSWPYVGKEVFVLSSSPLVDPPENVQGYAGDLESLVADLKKTEAGDIWIVGGAKTIRAFLDIGAVDQLELFLMPLVLGDGIPLFERSQKPLVLKLIETKTFPKGVVELVYEVNEENGPG